MDPIPIISRMTYQAAYAAALLMPGSKETKEARARAFAAKTEANAQKHAPAGIAVAVNLFVLGFLGSVTVRRGNSGNPDMETTIESFVSNTPEGEPPGGEGGVEAVLANAQTAMTPPSTTALMAPSVITTMAPSTLSFDVQLPSGSGIVPNGLRPATAGQSQGAPVNRNRGLGVRIGALNIQYQKLGIILDISGSMETHAQTVQRLAKTYRHTSLTEIVGCSLVTEASEPSLNPNRQNVMPVLSQMVGNNIDTILWMCDLTDDQDPIALNDLEALLLQKGVRLHVSSWDRLPSPRLMEIVLKTGGSAEVSGMPYPLPANDPKRRITELVFDENGFVEVRGLPSSLPGEPTRTYADTMRHIEGKSTTMVYFPRDARMTSEEKDNIIKNGEEALKNLPVQSNGSVRFENPIIPENLLKQIMNKDRSPLDLR